MVRARDWFDIIFFFFVVKYYQNLEPLQIENRSRRKNLFARGCSSRNWWFSPTPCATTTKRTKKGKSTATMVLLIHKRNTHLSFLFKRHTKITLLLQPKFWYHFRYIKCRKKRKKRKKTQQQKKVSLQKWIKKNDTFCGISQRRLTLFYSFFFY